MGRTVAGTTLGPGVGELLRGGVKAGSRHRDNVVQRHDGSPKAGSSMCTLMDGLNHPLKAVKSLKSGCPSAQERKKRQATANGL
jgi:hypothetical protein